MAGVEKCFDTKARTGCTGITTQVEEVLGYVSLRYLCLLSLLIATHWFCINPLMSDCSFLMILSFEKRKEQSDVKGLRFEIKYENFTWKKIAKQKSCSFMQRAGNEYCKSWHEPRIMCWPRQIFFLNHFLYLPPSTSWSLTPTFPFFSILVAPVILRNTWLFFYQSSDYSNLDENASPAIKLGKIA